MKNREKFKTNAETGKQFWKAAETVNLFLKAAENRKDPKRQWYFAETGRSEKKLWKAGKMNIFPRKTAPLTSIFIVVYI